MPKAIRIGTSGWMYNHWRGTFYPQQLRPASWFGFYAGLFDTVEINNTFYRLPPAETFDAWRTLAPPGFIYAVKMNRYLTHMLKLTNIAEPLERFFSRAGRLRETLGPVLFQLPPRWKKDLDRLGELFSQLPPGRLHVIEFRDRSWLADDTFDLMSRHGIALCIHDLLSRHPRVVTGAAVYLRFHGMPPRGAYSRRRLSEWAGWIAQTAENVPVYAYFNNDLHGYAVQDALTLRQMTGALSAGAKTRMN